MYIHIYRHIYTLRDGESSSYMHIHKYTHRRTPIYLLVRAHRPAERPHGGIEEDGLHHIGGLALGGDERGGGGGGRGGRCRRL
jgi:hypothetical protein